MIDSKKRYKILQDDDDNGIMLNLCRTHVAYTMSVNPKAQVWVAAGQNRSGS